MGPCFSTVKTPRLRLGFGQHTTVPSQPHANCPAGDVTDPVTDGSFVSS